MTLLQSILLGLIQGLTEFLPISSSAHLVLTPYLLGWNIPADQAFVFDVLVQVATLVAVIIYFWNDLFTIARAWLAAVLRCASSSFMSLRAALPATNQSSASPSLRGSLSATKQSSASMEEIASQKPLAMTPTPDMSLRGALSATKQSPTPAEGIASPQPLAMTGNLLAQLAFGDPSACLGWYLILASIPAGLVGLLLKDAVETAFASPRLTALFLFVTAGLLLVAERASKCSRSIQDLTWKDALWIGCAQILAIFPGISRSGATIAGGMTRHLERPSAARFSFLMSVPIMLAAGLLAVLDLLKVPHFTALLPAFIPGFLAAALTGYLSIRWLLGFLARRPLYGFAVYCVTLGLLTLIISLAR